MNQKPLKKLNNMAIQNVKLDDKMEIISVPDKVAIYTDKKTGVKSVAFPFSFPDGMNGIITVTKLVKMGWQPSDDIDNIQLNFKQ